MYFARKDMKKDKKWEVIITTFVGITGVIIAGLTYETNRLQAKVAKNGSLPNFVVEEKAEYDEMNITVQMYPCSEGTDTGSPALRYRESGTGIPRFLHASLLA